jgi:co-chaperonin GroES (HSP10)
MITPVNRYILIDLKKEETQEESLIVLPEDYKPAEARYIVVSAVRAATDVRFDLPPGANLVVDRSMIEEISIGDTNYNVILDNYVIGIVK